MKNKKFNLAVLLVLAFALFVPHVGIAYAAPLSDEEFIQLIRGGGTAQEVEAAIRAGANANAIGDIWAALTWAVRYNSHIEVISTLISNGANVNSRDEIRDSTALTFALSNLSNSEVINVLIEAGADVNHELRLGLREGIRVQAMLLLLASGADANAVNWNGDTPLMLAVDIGDRGRPQPDAMITLIEHGADVNARNNHGMTALMWATGLYWGNPDTISMHTLLANGADANVVNLGGRTALMLAAESMHADGNTDVLDMVITMLLEHGADVNVRCPHDLRAIDYARNNPALVNTDAFRRLEAASR